MGEGDLSRKHWVLSVVGPRCVRRAVVPEEGLGEPPKQRSWSATGLGVLECGGRSPRGLATPHWGRRVVGDCAEVPRESGVDVRSSLCHRSPKGPQRHRFGRRRGGDENGSESRLP